MKEFSKEVRTIFGDTDAMGIVYNGNYARFFEIGRTELLREVGFPYEKLAREGLWLPVTELFCRYKQPIRYDEIIDVHASLAEVKAATIVLDYKIVIRGEEGKPERLAATGFTKHAVTDSKLNPVRIREYRPDFYEVLMSLL